MVQERDIKGTEYEVNCNAGKVVFQYCQKCETETTFIFGYRKIKCTQCGIVHVFFKGSPQYNNISFSFEDAARLKTRVIKMNNLNVVFYGDEAQDVSK